jgi:hypothetical protein
MLCSAELVDCRLQRLAIKTMAGRSIIQNKNEREASPSKALASAWSLMWIHLFSLVWTLTSGNEWGADLQTMTTTTILSMILHRRLFPIRTAPMTTLMQTTTSHPSNCTSEICHAPLQATTANALSLNLLEL